MKLPPPATPGETTSNLLTAPFEARLDPSIELFDTTLREGEQPPGVVFTADEKLEIARALDEFGMHGISIGFPAVSAEEREIARRLTGAGLGMETAALSRLLPGDIDACVEVGADVVSLFLGGSDTHLFDKLRMTEEEACERIEAAVRRAKDCGKICWFAIEDGTRTPLRRLVRLYQVAVDAGVDLINFVDTLGVLTPTATTRIVRLLVALLPCPLAVHFHNDLGLALANTLAALEAGARGANTTINGVGERCGNVSLDELAVVLRIKYGLGLGLKLERLQELSALLHRISGTEPAAHKPVTGRWCFSHESGIHVAGVLANREAYQPYPPELVGRRHEILFGKHSGSQGVYHLAREAGLELSEAVCKGVLEKIKQRAEETRTSVPEEQILEWIRAGTDSTS